MDDGTFTLRGVTIGVDPYILTRPPTGILDTPVVRTDDQPRPRRNGVTPGDDLLGSKLMSFEVAVVGDSPADAEQKAIELAAAFAPAAHDEWLSARISGTPSEYAFLGRARGADVLVDHVLVQDPGKSTIYARASFVATDPIRYGVTSTETTITMAPEGDGLMYPVEYPLVYSSAGGVGQESVVNSGTAAVDWMATLTGPLTNPRLEHVDSGRDIQLAATLATGEVVVLDSAAGSILLNGTTPRPSWFAPGSSWFQLLPGSNLLRLTADAGTGTATIQHRSGWI